MEGSSQPRKQRKALYKAPMHKRQKKMTAHLSEELRDEHGRKSFSIRKGDSVELLRGDLKGHKGKVEKVDLNKCRIFVEGVTSQKADGSDRFYPVHPSNVMIVKMELKDEKRENSVARATNQE